MAKQTLLRRDMLKMMAAGGALAAGVPVIAPARARTAAQGGGRLAIWGYNSFTPEGDQLLEDQMMEWGAANNVEIEYVLQGAEMPERLAAALEAQAPPDMVMLTSPAVVLDYAGRGLFADLTDVWDEVSAQAGGFAPYVEPLYQVEGARVGIPFEAETSPLFARLDLIEDVTGARETPTTFDELTTLSEEINNPPDLFALGLCLGRTGDTFADARDIIWNEGGALVDEEGRVALSSPETLVAMNRVKAWWDAGLVPPDATTWDDTGNNTAYQSKRAAFVHNPPSIYGWMQQNDEELLGNSIMVAFPAGAAGSFSHAGAWSWSMFESSPNLDAGKELIRFLMEPERLQTVYEAVAGRWYPIHLDLQQNEYWTSRPIFNAYPELIANGRDNSWPAQPAPNLMAAIGEMQNRRVIADMVQEIIVRGVAPEDAVQTAHDTMVAIWEERGAPV